jgi:hypothetical protein
MDTQGTLGYKVGKKIYRMIVDVDANLLWQTQVREIYILMKHYGSKEALKMEFNKVKNIAKNKPSCKRFSDEMNDLKYCQFSLINMLESGYILSQKEEIGFVFMFDLNKGMVTFYNKNIDGTNKYSAVATLEEIMEFNDMPTRSLTEIISEMNDKYNHWFEQNAQLIDEYDVLIKIKNEALTNCDNNIINKVTNLINEIEYKIKQLKTNRRVFYNRLKALDLIEERNM